MPTTSAPVRLDDRNMFDALNAESDSKQMDAKLSAKDDIKQQAFELKNQLKVKGAQLKEQLVGGVEQAKNLVQDTIKQRGGNKQVEQEGVPEEGEWQTVHRKGGEKARKQMTSEIDAVGEQVEQVGAKLKKKGVKAQAQVNQIMQSGIVQKTIRQGRAFIRRNNLSIPLLVLCGCVCLYMCLSMIHWATTPKMTWSETKIEQGKDAIEQLKNLENLRDLKEKAGSNLHDWNLRYQDLKNDLLARAEGWATPSRPLTWSEWLGDWSDSWFRTLTGRPQLTNMERIQLQLQRQAAELKSHANHYSGMASDKVGAIKNSILHTSDKVKATVEPSLYDKLKSHLPGHHSTVDDIKGSAYDLKHKAELAADQSGSILSKAGREAEYAKNRVIHGTESVLHTVQDNVNELMDKAKKHLP